MTTCALCISKKRSIVYSGYSFIFFQAVEHATYVHDIAHVIIDNMQFMMGISDESKHMDR